MLRSALAAAMLALNAPPADYQVCTKVHNGPIHPQRHINGLAPLADIV